MENQVPQTIQQPPNKSKKLVCFLIWLASTIILAIILNGKYGTGSLVNAKQVSRGGWGLAHALTGAAGSVIGIGILGFVVSFIVCFFVKKWRNMESVLIGAAIFNAVFFVVVVQ